MISCILVCIQRQLLQMSATDCVVWLFSLKLNTDDNDDDIINNLQIVVVFSISTLNLFSLSIFLISTTTILTQQWLKRCQKLSQIGAGDLLSTTSSRATFLTSAQLLSRISISISILIQTELSQKCWSKASMHSHFLPTVQQQIAWVAHC